MFILSDRYFYIWYIKIIFKQALQKLPYKLIMTLYLQLCVLMCNL